jgi:hypothetical protein
MDSISRSQLQKGDIFRKQYEQEIYNKEVEKYTSEVVEAITKNLVSQLNSKGCQKYTYYFGKSHLPGHPHIPPFLNNNQKNIYQNDYENIYPVYDIFNALKAKFPDVTITMNKHTFDITLDWS